MTNWPVVERTEKERIIFEVARDNWQGPREGNEWLGFEGVYLFGRRTSRELIAALKEAGRIDPDDDRHQLQSALNALVRKRKLRTTCKRLCTVSNVTVFEYELDVSGELPEPKETFKFDVKTCRRIEEALAPLIEGLPEGAPEPQPILVELLAFCRRKINKKTKQAEVLDKPKAAPIEPFRLNPIREFDPSAFTAVVPLAASSDEIPTDFVEAEL